MLAPYFLDAVLRHYEGEGEGEMATARVGVVTAMLSIMLVLVLGFEVLLGLGGIYWVKRKHKMVRAGWNLQPVLVANQHISAGTLATEAMFVERQVPEQFVTTALIQNRNSLKSILGQPIAVNMQPGDLLRWSDSATMRHPALCVRKP